MTGSEIKECLVEDRVLYVTLGDGTVLHTELHPALSTRDDIEEEARYQVAQHDRAIRTRTAQLERWTDYAQPYVTQDRTEKGSYSIVVHILDLEFRLPTTFPQRKIDAMSNGEVDEFLRKLAVEHLHEQVQALLKL